MWIPSLTKFASILNFHPMCNFWKFKCILNKQTIDGNRLNLDLPEIQASILQVWKITGNQGPKTKQTDF
jgi:hypothetical protein